MDENRLMKRMYESHVMVKEGLQDQEEVGWIMCVAA